MAFSTTGMVFFFKTGSFKKPLTMLLYIEALKYHDTNCLLYTSDAADEEDSVDLGGRRFIKKKIKKKKL